MTVENQDINEDFYEGVYKRLAVAIWEDEDLSVPKDMSGGELTYVIYNDKDEFLLIKSSNNGDSEIKFIDDSNIEIYIDPSDTIGLYGTHNHMLNGVDSDGKVATLLTGRCRIFKGFAMRVRESAVQAYLEGGS